MIFEKEVCEKLSPQLLQQISAYLEIHWKPERLAEAALPKQIVPDDCEKQMLRRSVCRKSMDVLSMDCALEDILRGADAGFSETLLKRIDETGKKDSEIYKRANLSKQHFSKIRNNPDYRPTKATAIALALALEMDVEQTKDLIGRAGYTLSNSSKFDLIIRYYIEQGRYDIVEINMALYEFDQPLLGN